VEVKSLLTRSLKKVVSNSGLRIASTEWLNDNQLRVRILMPTKRSRTQSIPTLLYLAQKEEGLEEFNDKIENVVKNASNIPNVANVYYPADRQNIFRFITITVASH